MPSTVAEIFAAAGLEAHGPVQWDAPVLETAQGVYMVALTDDPDSLTRPVALRNAAKPERNHYNMARG